MNQERSAADKRGPHPLSADAAAHLLELAPRMHRPAGCSIHSTGLPVCMQTLTVHINPSYPQSLYSLTFMPWFCSGP